MPSLKMGLKLKEDTRQNMAKAGSNPPLTPEPVLL